VRFVYTLESIQPADAEAAEFFAGLQDGDHLDVQPVKHTRTSAQNRAIHKYCTMLADALSAAGVDMLTFPWREGLEIPFSQTSVKDLFWRPIQKAMLGTTSTAGLETDQVDQVYRAVDRAVSERTGVSVEFPSRHGP
jgi:hypothetical protein